MKKIEKVEDLPEELLKHFEFDQNEIDELNDVDWDDVVDDLIHMVKDSVGYSGDPKKKAIGNEDYYVHTFKLKCGKKTIVAQTKQYIKDFPDVICDEEPHGLFIKKWL